MYAYNKRTISLKVDPLIHSALKYYCLEEGKTIQQIVEKILREFIQGEKMLDRYTAVKKRITKKPKSG
jgi:hypothetical protein